MRGRESLRRSVVLNPGDYGCNPPPLRLSFKHTTRRSLIERLLSTHPLRQLHGHAPLTSLEFAQDEFAQEDMIGRPYRRGLSRNEVSAYRAAKSLRRTYAVRRDGDGDDFGLR
jgi:hypothetical protein